MNPIESGYGAYDVTLEGTTLQEINYVSMLNSNYEHPDRYSDSFDRRRFVGKLHALQIGELCLASSAFSSNDIDSTVVTAELLEKPELGKARHESRTEVKFGQLIVDTKLSGQRADLVAVKYTTPKLAAREFLAMKHINDNASVGCGSGSFVPIGFAKNSNDRASVGLITKYDHSVLTLDALFWRLDIPPNTDELEFGLGHAALWMSRMHSSGLAHGDAQVKNIGFDRSSRPHYPDLEDAVNLKESDGSISIADARVAMKDDLVTFLQSLGGEYHTAIETHFTPNYIRGLGTPELRSQLDMTEAVIKDISYEPQRPIPRMNKYL